MLLYKNVQLRTGVYNNGSFVLLHRPVGLRRDPAHNGLDLQDQHRIRLPVPAGRWHRPLADFRDDDDRGFLSRLPGNSHLRLRVAGIQGCHLVDLVHPAVSRPCTVRRAREHSCEHRPGLADGHDGPVLRHQWRLARMARPQGARVQRAGDGLTNLLWGDSKSPQQEPRFHKAGFSILKTERGVGVEKHCAERPAGQSRWRRRSKET